MITKGRAVVWGVPSVRPIVNIPPDALKVRVRLRPNDFGKAFVKFSDRLEQWGLEPVGPGLSGDWRLGWLLGINQIKLA